MGWRCRVCGWDRKTPYNVSSDAVRGFVARMQRLTPDLLRDRGLCVWCADRVMHEARKR
jgi:hypothetical protein